MSSDAMTSHRRVQSCPALPQAFRRNSREGNTRNLHSESPAFIDMVSSCSVKNCHNRQDRDRDRRFFSVPFVVNGKGKETRDLTARRRREWLAQLQLKNFNFESTARRYVCSDHFVNGQPSTLWEVNSPSWTPTLKLGYGAGTQPDSQQGRYQRLMERKKLVGSESTPSHPHLAEDAGYGNGEGTSDTAELATPLPERGDCGGTYCQTETYDNFAWMSKDEEKQLRDELNRLMLETQELKDELAKKKMTLDSLRDNDDTVRYFTGISNFFTLATLFDFLAPHLPTHSRRALTQFQALMLTSMHIRLNTPLQHLAYIVSVSRTTASKVFHETVHIMYHRLQPLVFWPDRRSIKTSLPPQFLPYPWNRVVSIIDCFEIFIERPSSVDASALTWSNYKHNNTIKYLISITPQGHISFISKGWGGRTSDKHITANSGYLDNIVQNDVILADRGFDIHELVAMRGAQVKIPAFTRGKSQLTAYEIESTRKLANLRIHVERVIGILCGKYKILNSDIPTDLLFAREGEEVVTLDKIVTVSSGLVNVCTGIM